MIGTESQTLDQLAALSRAQHTAAIEYLKPWEKQTTSRVVEAYQLQESNGNVIVRCWQLVPEISDCTHCWRSFRIDRIQKVADGGSTFEPRRKMTICEGELHPFAFNREPRAATAKSRVQGKEIVISFEIGHGLPDPDAPVSRYKRAVEGFLADGVVTLSEMTDALEKFEDVPEEEKRMAHAQVFAGALHEVMLDGKITDAESQYLHKLGENLRTLGWAP